MPPTEVSEAEGRTTGVRESSGVGSPGRLKGINPRAFTETRRPRWEEHDVTGTTGQRGAGAMAPGSERTH